MKLELENSVQPPAFDYYFFKKNAFEMTDDEIGNMLRTGVKFAQEGNRTDSRHLLLRVTQADPENETAWLWLASISEYPEELLVFLQNVLKINPENDRAISWSKATQSLLAKTFVQRGIDASHDNQTSFAKQCFLQAIYYDNENEMAWLWLASITEDVEEKIIYLQKVLNFDPENETALETIKALRKESPQSLLKKANSAAISGDRETAGIMLEEVMQDAPELEEAWILKAYLANDFYEKLGCYEKVLSINPANEAARAGMASLKILMGEVEPQPENIQPETESSIEFSSRENQENWQAEAKTEESVEPESIQESAAFAEETYENAFSEERSAEKPEETVDFYQSVESVENPQPEGQFSVNEVSENHLYESQTPGLEVEVYEFSTGNVENTKEEASFHSEIPMQNPEEMQSKQVDFQAEPEVELVGFRHHDAEQAADLPDSEFSLNVDDSEVYAIDENQTYFFDNFQPENEDYQKVSAENETENFSFSSETAETVEAAEQNFEQNFVGNHFPVEENQPATQLNENYETNVSYEASAEENHAINDFYEVKDHENNAAHEYFGNYDQPTVEFSYPQQNDSEISAKTPEYEPETFENHFADSSGEISEAQTESPEIFAANQDESFAAESEVYQENVNCPFCGFDNEAQVISCNSCRAILSLSDLEMVLAHQDADHDVLTQFIEMAEAESQLREFNETELCLLGIAQLNAKNLRKGFSLLQEASRLNPNNVVLSSKVNFLAIRLSEIEAQENKNQENVTVSRMIMVVDDSPTVRKLISGKLEKSGHSVITANDGLEALAKINETVPDLVLLDIAMPQMDGYQVCKMIRSNEATKDIPVVMISGKDGFFDKVRGKMAGSTGYITKPFGPETLMKTLESYIA